MAGPADPGAEAQYEVTVLTGIAALVASIQWGGLLLDAYPEQAANPAYRQASASHPLGRGARQHWRGVCRRYRGSGFGADCPGPIPHAAGARTFYCGRGGAAPGSRRAWDLGRGEQAFPCLRRLACPHPLPCSPSW